MDKEKICKIKELLSDPEAIELIKIRAICELVESAKKEEVKK